MPVVLQLCVVLLGLMAALLTTGCRATAMRHISGVSEGIARLNSGGTVRAEADRLVGAVEAQGKLYGMVIGVVLPDGSTQVFGYGRTGIKSLSGPPDAQSLFQVGSISKLFLTALLQQLVEQGRMRYEDTLSEILPPQVCVSEEVGDVTIYELATHTAGLPREPINLTQFWSFQKYLLTGQNLYGHINTNYLYRYLKSCRLKPKQDRQFEYSNFGMGLLAHMIHLKTGEDVNEMILKRICEPLGMTNTVFELNQEQKLRLTVGHAGNHACWKFPNNRMPLWEMGEVMSPSSGLYSSLEDLLLFAKAHLGYTTNDLSETLRTTRKVQVNSSSGGQAFGWILCPGEVSGTPVLYKHGMLSGYWSYIGLGIENRVGVVVLANRFDWDERVGHNLILRMAGASPASLLRSGITSGH